MPKFLSNIDMNGNCIFNAVIPEIAELQGKVDALTATVALLAAKLPKPRKAKAKKAKVKVKAQTRKRKQSAKSRV